VRGVGVGVGIPIAIAITTAVGIVAGIRFVFFMFDACGSLEGGIIVVVIITNVTNVTISIIITVIVIARDRRHHSVIFVAV